MSFKFSSYLLYLGTSKGLGLGGLITLNYANLFDVQNPKSCTYLRSFVKILNTFYISCPYFADQCAKAHISPSTTQSSARRCPSLKILQGVRLKRELQEDASPGYLPLEASRGLILRVTAMNRKRFARTCRFARMKASRGCHLSREPLEDLGARGEQV